MTYIRTHHKARVKDALIHALSALDLAVEYMEDIIDDHDRASFYALRMIDDVDLLNIYTKQIERIVKEI